MTQIFSAAANTFVGTVAVTGATTFGSTVGVTGAVTLSSTLSVAGTTTLAKGHYRTNVVEKTGAYVATQDDDVILGDTAAVGAFSITLPAVASSAGKVYTFIRTGAGANALTIDGNGAETIDGAATDNRMDAQYDSLTIYCDGTEWFIIAEKIA